mmetsp:Transcript_43998/g.80397  ORF Transcript_43998/g.80397 Transcript_43998/m.80397 type:complete len:120 (+) Transcript_43998:67-426(+)
MQLNRRCSSALGVLLLVLGPRGMEGLSLRMGSSMSDCPLCVAEDNCHMACADVRSQSPGSKYCLEACIGAHPGDDFGEAWFSAADQKSHERAELDARLKELGDELAQEVQQRQASSRQK